MRDRKAFMGRSSWSLLGAVVLGIGVAAAAEAGPQFNNPLSTQVGIDVFPVNTYVMPGITRSTSGSGPLSDSGTSLFGANHASASASVDSAGLHATAAVHADATNNGYSALARASAGLTNPFIVVPRPGFTGTTATSRSPTRWGGRCRPTVSRGARAISLTSWTRDSRWPGCPSVSP